MKLTEQCPQCASKGEDTSGDNLVTHEDYGYKKCFKCGYYESRGGSLLLTGKYIDLADRGLSKTTCEKYGIQQVNYTGNFYPKKQEVKVDNERCVVFPSFKNGKVVKQKLRSLVNKQHMTLLGDTKFSSLFGKHALSPNKKRPIVITEGEFDAAAVYQATDFPAVSIPNGSADLSCLTKELSWLQQWKYVVLLFDNDEAGQTAIEKAISLLPVGTVRIAHISEKDANDMLLAGKGEELKSAIWNAEIHHPDSIVTVEDIIDDVLIKPEYGYSWPWEFMTEATYGIQPHHIYIISGAAQVGKTEWLSAVMEHLITKEGIPIGVFSLEQGSDNTIRRMVGRRVKRRLHLPSNSWWDETKIRDYAMEFNKKMFLYRNSSNELLSLESLLINIRYMYFCYGIKIIVIDNLTAMCNNPVIDSKYVGKFTFMGHVMNKLFTLSRELPLSILLVAHTDNDKISKKIHIPTSVENLPNYLNISDTTMDQMINKPGLTWDSGRMPSLGNIDGPDTISKLADYVIGLARNSISPIDEIKRTLRIKFLKARLASEFCGAEVALTYDYNTGEYK